MILLVRLHTQSVFFSVPQQNSQRHVVTSRSMSERLEEKNVRKTALAHKITKCSLDEFVKVFVFEDGGGLGGV